MEYGSQPLRLMTPRFPKYEQKKKVMETRHRPLQTDEKLRLNCLVFDL